MQPRGNSSTVLGIPDYEQAAACRAMDRVAEIIGWTDGKENRVTALGITNQGGHPAVVMFIRSAVGNIPVVPQTIDGIPVVRQGGLEEHALDRSYYVVTANAYRSMSSKVKSAVRDIASSLAAKFSKKLDISWPPSFKISDKYSVLVCYTAVEDQAGYLIEIHFKDETGVNWLQNQDMELLFNEQTTPEMVGDFTKKAIEGIESWHTELNLG